MILYIILLYIIYLSILFWLKKKKTQETEICPL